MKIDFGYPDQKRLIDAAFGALKADLVIKNGRVLNVFTNELERLDVAVHNGYVIGLGDYKGEEEIDVEGAYICPGLIDGHIHLESSMLSPAEFAKAVVPHGTTAVITDPHEIANVTGGAGIDYMLEATKNLPLDVFFMLPSCVPATDMDESGALLNAGQLRTYYGDPRVLGLAEMMNAFGTVRGDDEIIKKIADAKENGRVIDGHAPGLSGRELNAYVVAGVTSDHECSTAAEAIEKIRRGQWVMIREGTAAKNLSALLPLFGKNYHSRCMLVTDDKHPGDLIHNGHIDYIIREAVRRGENPIYAVKMASYHTARYFGLKDRGAVAPGFMADFIIVEDLQKFHVSAVYKRGKRVAENGALCVALNKKEISRAILDQVHYSFHNDPLKPEDIRLKQEGKFKRVIGLTPGELLTKDLIVSNHASKDSSLAQGVEPELDIVKLAVIERHKNTGHIGLGFVYGYGLKKGAVASSISHDSHNLIVIGTNDEDICLAANTVRKNQGGLALAAEGNILGELPLPIAGLMCEEDACFVEKRLNELKALARQLGVSDRIDAFMTLAFLSLPVIPSLRLTTQGLVDVENYRFVPSVF